jgi:hypothetical protein
MNTIEISPLETVVIGGTWKKTINLVPESGSLTVTAVADYLMARDSTSNVDSSYVTGSPAFSTNGSQVTTGEVGTGSIPPGKYTYFLTVSHSAGVYVLYQNLEFVPMKGQ